jgi:hypothetical protein
MWVLPNRFYFTKWFYDTFHPSKYLTQSTFDPSQQLIKDYIHTDSPYRGVLAYFGLGAGKSAASILASESFVSRHKKVIVLLPSSLENNYRKELTKFSRTGKLMHKKWYLVEVDPTIDFELFDRILQTFQMTRDQVKKMARLWLPYLPKDFPPSKVVQEATFKSLPEEDKALATQVYTHILDTRYTFIHYNGVTNKHLDKLEAENTLDDALIIIDEVHTFISRVVSGGKIARRLYNMLIAKDNLRFVLLSGTPVINHPFELCYTLNLLRGPMTEYTFQARKGKFFPPFDQLITAFGDTYKHIDLLELDPTNTQMTFTLLPKGFVRKDNSSELVAGKSIPLEKIIHQLKTTLPINMRYKTDPYTAFPDKKETFINFFLDTTDPLNPIVKKDAMDVFLRRIQGIVSYYRIADEELFPTQRPLQLKAVPMSPRQFQYYAEVRNEEIQQDDRNKRKRARNQDIFQTNSSYRAYSRMACNFVFPEEIPRPFPKEIRKKIIRKEIDIEEEDLDQDTEDEEEEQAPKAKEIAKQAAKIYEQEVRQTLQKLFQQGDTYLQGPGLYDCSPKLHTFLQDITTHTHVKSLFYSQFRTVEGIKLVTLALKQAGWIQIDFLPDGRIANATEVLDPKYDYKRFLVFGDKEKTDNLLALYNGDFKMLPKPTQEQLKAFPENLHGKLASLLMITQSGAEGLNLRCVRYVYIFEPFWNQVRIDQVIGRAIRKRSHLELPPDERNVQVIQYLATFTPKQAKANKTIQFRDDSKTTDENIKELAAKKDHIIQQFLTLLKSNAIDCLFHATKNKPLEHNYTCYVPPLNLNLNTATYIPNITKDKSTLAFGMQERTRKVKGRAALLGERKLVEVEGKLYDYDAYVSAGVLMAVDV